MVLVLSEDYVVKMGIFKSRDGRDGPGVLPSLFSLRHFLTIFK